MTHSRSRTTFSYLGEKPELFISTYFYIFTNDKELYYGNTQMCNFFGMQFRVLNKGRWRTLINWNKHGVMQAILKKAHPQVLTCASENFAHCRKKNVENYFLVSNFGYDSNQIKREVISHLIKTCWFSVQNTFCLMQDANFLYWKNFAVVHFLDNFGVKANCIV